MWHVRPWNPSIIPSLIIFVLRLRQIHSFKAQSWLKWSFGFETVPSAWKCRNVCWMTLVPSNELKSQLWTCVLFVTIFLPRPKQICPENSVSILCVSFTWNHAEIGEEAALDWILGNKNHSPRLVFHQAALTFLVSFLVVAVLTDWAK